MEANIISAGIGYEPVQELAFPKDVYFKAFLNAENYVKTKTKGFFKGDKEGLFHIRRGQILPPEYDSVSDFGFGCVEAVKGRQTSLYNADGVPIAGEECSAVMALTDALFAKKVGKAWGIFRLADGSEALPCAYSGLSDVSEDTIVLYGADGARITDLGGSPVVPGVYRAAYPFRNGFARVETDSGVDYITRDGKVIYSDAGKDSRDFCNGYAVIADRKGKLGAIDAEGRVVIPPQYLFLRDFGDGFFMCSNTGMKMADGQFNGRDYGAVNGSGKVIIPLSKLFIAPRGDGSLTFGRGEVWQVTSGNTRTTYRVGVTGVADLDGNIILPEKYVAIGESRDGLAPFKSYENMTMTLGYMRPDGSTAFVVAREDYTGDMSDRPRLRAELSTQLGAFADGKARVFVRQSSAMEGMFKKTQRDRVVEAGESYYIDTNGQETTPPDASKARGGADVAFSAELPFADKIRAMGDWGQYFIKLRPFSGMIEMTAGEASFAIFDESGRLLLSKWDGTDLRVIPEPRHSEYLALQHTGGGLWVGVKKARKGDGVVNVVWVSAFESPTVFGSGLAPFRVANGKKWLWGYTDIHGNDVVAPKYEKATGFEGDKAYAKKPDGTEVILTHLLKEQSPASAPAVPIEPASAAPAAPAATRFCTQCGAPLASDAAFCTKCGAQQRTP